MNLQKSNMGQNQYCCMKDCEGNSSIENLKLCRYHLRDPVMIYVDAVCITQFCVHRTKYHIIGLMHQHMRIVFSELTESVLLFDIVL